MSGFVYFITPEAPFNRDDNRAVKIGYTKGSPKARLASLQTGCPMPLDILGYVDGTLELERLLHETFAPVRLLGEWFMLEGKLHDFLGYFYERGPYISFDRFWESFRDNVLASGSPGPWVTDEDYCETADPGPLNAWFGSIFADEHFGTLQ